MESLNASSLRIELVGSMAVTGPSGEDLTPKGSRSRAAIALIAMSPRQRASRRWLEAMIWPDRDEKQASGSLRQVLTGIRRQLGSHAKALGSDRMDVWLMPDNWALDIDDRRGEVLAKIMAGRDFLEGINLGSEEFEDWLRQERSELHAEAEAAAARTGHIPAAPDLDGGTVGLRAPPVLYGDTFAAASSLEAYFVEVIRTQMAQTVSAFARTEVRFLDGVATPTLLAPGARCSLRIADNGGKCDVVARLTREPDGKIIWMRRLTFDSNDPEAVLDSAAALAMEGGEAFSQMAIAASEPQKANAMAFQALEEVFSFAPDRLARGIRLLDTAQQMDPHAPRPALQALATAFLALETSGSAEGETVDIVQPLVDAAMRLDSGNALALSFLADVHDLVYGDTQTAMGLARCALRSNPGMGYAYASLGAFELRRGRLKEAKRAAQKAHRQLANTTLEVFSLMRLCVTSMNIGEIGAATLAAERAAELAPFSCPPLRHLYALRLSQGDQDGARQALRALRRLEPEFSLKRLREDKSLPAPSLRRMGFDKLTDVEI